MKYLSNIPWFIVGKKLNKKTLLPTITIDKSFTYNYLYLEWFGFYVGIRKKHCDYEGDDIE